MTSKENLNEILKSMPHDIPEITHVILKSQITSKAKRASLSKRV